MAVLVKFDGMSSKAENDHVPVQADIFLLVCEHIKSQLQPVEVIKEFILWNDRLKLAK